MNITCPKSIFPIPKKLAPKLPTRGKADWRKNSDINWNKMTDISYTLIAAIKPLPIPMTTKPITRPLLEGL